MFFPNYFDSDPNNNQQGCPVEIPLKITFTEALSKRLHILYDEKNQSYKLETSMLVVPDFINTAYAETKPTHEKKKVESADFKQEVISALAFVTKMPEQKISLDASLREDLKLSGVKLSYVYARLSKKFDIDGYDRAWNSAKKVRDLVNLSSEHYKLIGIDYYKAGEYDKAVEFYEKSLGLNLQDERTFNYKGYSLYKSKKYKEAIEALRKSNEINPGYFMARLNLAKVYCSTGTPEKAEQILFSNPKLSEADILRAQNDSEFESVCKDVFLKIKDRGKKP
jgi:tetratricopeptide (TPR) repeat protein